MQVIQWILREEEKPQEKEKKEGRNVLLIFLGLNELFPGIFKIIKKDMLIFNHSLFRCYLISMSKNCLRQALLVAYCRLHHFPFLLNAKKYLKYFPVQK